MEDSAPDAVQGSRNTHPVVLGEESPQICSGPSAGCVVSSTFGTHGFISHPRQIIFGGSHCIQQQFWLSLARCQLA